MPGSKGRFNALARVVCAKHPEATNQHTKWNRSYSGDYGLYAQDHGGHHLSLSECGLE